MRRALFALCLMGCASPGAEPVGSRRSAVQGGASDASDRFAVGIFDEQGGTCSGTLIAPNLVLTARHCVAGGGSDPIDCAADTFSAPRAAASFRVSTAASATWDDAERAASEVLVPDDAKFCGNDLALLILDADVDVPTAAPSLALPQVESLTAIGYGTSAPDASDEGRRRRLDGVAIACVPGSPSLDCDPSSFSMVESELAAGDGLCEGDSGSGAYVTQSIASGAPVVIGVLSRAADYRSSCVDAVYVRTDAFASFLVSAARDAAKIGGYPVPAWASPPPDAPALPADDAGALPADAPAPAAPAPAASSGEGGCSSAGTGASRVSPGAAALLAVAALALHRRKRVRLAGLQYAITLSTRPGSRCLRPPRKASSMTNA